MSLVLSMVFYFSPVKISLEKLSNWIGAMAIVIANPTDLVKVRLQAEGKLPAGVPGRYAGALDAYFTIVRQVCCLLFFWFYIVMVLIFSSFSIYLGRTGGLVDWTWAKYSKECYYKCCWTRQLWWSETGRIMVFRLLSCTYFIFSLLFLWWI